MPTAWDLNAETFSPERRRRFADEAADRANPFRRDGFQVMAPLMLRERENILAHISGAAWINKGSDLIQHISPDAILASPALHDLANRHDIITAAAMHIGALPKILDVSLWRTLPGDGGDEAAQRWHRDVDDWRACKLFVYLNDVGPDQGPHQFVAGSHRPEFFEMRGLPPDRFFIHSGRGMDDVVDTFPRLEVQGNAGLCWLENTYGLHRGTPVRSGERIVFQVLYGLMDLENMMFGTKIPAIRKAWG